MKLVHVLFFITIGMFSIGLVACGASEVENEKEKNKNSMDEKKEAYDSAINYIHIFYGQKVPDDTIEYEDFEDSIIIKRSDGFYHITSTFYTNKSKSLKSYEYEMLLDSNYDILDAYIPGSIGIFDRPMVYDKLGQSAISNILENESEVAETTDKESEISERNESSKDENENNKESTYEPEYMDQEEWETCINSSVYSEEECREYDKYYAHGEGQNEPGHSHELYVNDRFGFSVEYPDNFTVDSLPDNNDGITVHDDNATLTVFGTHGWSSTNGDYVTISEVDSIKAIYEQEIADLEGIG